ncbi:hypothetical protein A6E13_01930 [Aliivibrio fischeri]|uniref:hypothetical protein n=1 Tax=Aliivibrio fischeri TaxID=668 RepID=UPI00080DBD47|nr:hypothetical protein [Aliivibrio fischeri]OCH31313.1 hypothetical protein A6E13_01930 [Aliivibrio fischeri]
MAIFKHRLTKQQIEQDYTHYAFLFCVVPIYFNYKTSAVCVRNGCPEWLLDMFQAFFDLYCVIATSINPELEPMFPIKLTKEIKGSGHETN